MILLLTLASFMVGYEGYEDGKYYFGVYTPTAEYGWVVKDGEIWLDTVYTKDR